MFKNIGRVQIISNKVLHFSSVPYFDKPSPSKILIKHYGLFDRKDRLKKYEFYKKNDVKFMKNNQSGMYDLLLDDNAKLKPINEIFLN